MQSLQADVDYLDREIDRLSREINESLRVLNTPRTHASRDQRQRPVMRTSNLMRDIEKVSVDMLVVMNACIIIEMGKGLQKKGDRL